MSGVGERTRGHIPGHTLVLISAMRSVRLQLNNLKHLPLKLNCDNSRKRLRNHHGLFSEMIMSMCSSSSQQKTTKCWALSGRTLRTRQRLCFVTVKTLAPMLWVFFAVLVSTSQDRCSRVQSREEQQTRSRDEASNVWEEIEPSGILNLMKRRCVGRLTEVYKIMKVVDWMTAGLLFTPTCNIRGTC